MNWDIDKALTALEASDIAGTTVVRATMIGVELLERHIGKLSSKEREIGAVLVWSFSVGKQTDRKLTYYGRTIHSAYLKARKELKTLSPEQLDFYGVNKPKKRSNSYIAARKKNRK